MKQPSRIAAIVVAGLCASALAQRTEPLSLQDLYQRHGWFELREAIGGKTAPVLYAGAVASAFNRTRDAETQLNQAVREASTIEVANDAREALVNLYMRLGRSSEMLRILDEALAAAPSRADFRNIRVLFESFRQLPDQSVRLNQPLPFKCEVSTRGVVLPVVVNGKAVQWLFDSGFSHSAMSESEARMVGVSVQGETASAGDFAAGTATTRAAIVERMTIGGAELRNVPVLVFPDSQPPWNEAPAGRRGAIGVPVALALQAIRWTKDGTCRVGRDPRRMATPDVNLAFDGVTPIARVQFLGKRLEFVLDTGNQGGTQLWERFASDFPHQMSEGRQSTLQLHQIGGSTERQIVILPEIRLQIGGFDGTLQPARVFSKPIGNDLQHGNLGLDILSRAAEVIIDFQTMSLTVR